jgi:hypothetical protein
MVLGIRYPSYLQEAADKAKLDRMVSVINAFIAPDRSEKIQSAINWLAEKKEAFSAKDEFPELRGGFPMSEATIKAYHALNKAIADAKVDDATRFTAFVRLHQQLEAVLTSLRSLYSVEDLMPFGVAFFLKLGLNPSQEMALVRVLQNRPDGLADEIDSLATHYSAILLYVSNLKLACCVDLAQAGVNSPKLIKRVDLALFRSGDLGEIYSNKIDSVLAMPARTSEFREAQIAKIDQLKTKYFERILKEAEDAMRGQPDAVKDEQTRKFYLKKFEFYQQLWAKELPVSYLKLSLAEIDQICLDAECFKAFAIAVFSIRTEAVKAEQFDLIKRLTGSIWRAAERIVQDFDCRLLWLRALAVHSNKDKALRPFLRERLSSLPAMELKQVSKRTDNGHNITVGVLNFTTATEVDDTLDTTAASRP